MRPLPYTGGFLVTSPMCRVCSAFVICVDGKWICPVHGETIPVYPRVLPLPAPSKLGKVA